MEQNSIRPIIKELEKIYDILAKEYKLDKIAKRPLITIQSQGGQKNTLGWHWKDKWKKGKTNISEINICAEVLNKNPIETLIHEMVHYHNASFEIMDCNAHQYHNKLFKIRAENYGLNVEMAGRNGWSHTSISKSLEKKLNTLKLNKKIFNLYRKGSFTNIYKSTTRMIKYNCGCTIVRCATNLKARCRQCGNLFNEG